MGRSNKLKFVDPEFKGKKPATQSKRSSKLAPPAKENEQPVPKSLQRIMAFSKRVKENGSVTKPKLPAEKSGEVRGKIKQQLKPSSTLSKNDPGSKKFVFSDRKGNETSKSYLRRVETEAAGMLSRVVKASSKKAQQRREFLKQKKEKKKQSKLTKKQNDDPFAHLNDKVNFGEVAAAPPSIQTLPRRAVKSDVAKPKRDLLIEKIVKKDREQVPRKHSSAVIAEQQSKIDAKTTPARAEMLLQERERVIQLYRMQRKRENHRARQDQNAAELDDDDEIDDE